MGDNGAPVDGLLDEMAEVGLGIGSLARPLCHAGLVERSSPTGDGASASGATLFSAGKNSGVFNGNAGALEGLGRSIKTTNRGGDDCASRAATQAAFKASDESGGPSAPRVKWPRWMLVQWW